MKSPEYIAAILELIKFHSRAVRRHYVYTLELICKTTGDVYYKVGYTSNIELRLAVLKYENPTISISCVEQAVYSTRPKAYAAEQALHTMLQDYRLDFKLLMHGSTECYMPQAIQIITRTPQ